MSTAGVILLTLALPGWVLGAAPLLGTVQDRSKLEARLESIQAEIAEAQGPESRYSKLYRHQERFYWLRIPAWMEQHAEILRPRKSAPPHILDIGCAYGTLLAFAVEIYGGRGHCLDVIAYLNPSFAARRGLRFTKGNVELAPVPWKGPFDVILFTEVLEHLNFYPVPTLRKIRAALARDGRLFLSTPDASQWGRQRKYYRRLADLPLPRKDRPFVDDHIWVYDETELRRVLQRAGFAIEKFDYSPGASGAGRHFNLMLRAR